MMKKILTAMVVSTVAIQANAMDVQVDKGELKLSFDSQIITPLVNVDKKPGCNSEVRVVVKKDKITALHENPDACPSGAVVRMVLPIKSQVNIQHGGGLISVSNTNDLLENFKKVEVNTLGGLIQTSDQRIKIQSQYGPASAVYDSGQNGAELKLNLTGGMIEFK